MKRALIVVAHPDDETLFFGGLVLSEPETEWEVACVTDGGPRSKERYAELQQACDALGVRRVHHLGFADTPGKRLPIEKIGAALETLGSYNKVYTHGPLGDYGNPHHQDVCVAVHRCYEGRTEVQSVATAVAPTKVVVLTTEMFEIKSRILAQIYKTEYECFLLLLPASPVEGFIKLELSEVEALYKFLNGDELKVENLTVHAPLAALLEAGGVQRSGDAIYAAYFGHVDPKYSRPA